MTSVYMEFIKGLTCVFIAELIEICNILTYSVLSETSSSYNLLKATKKGIA